MEATARHLIDTLEKALPLLRNISEQQAAHRPAPGKWSAKEIIGHLIDSAVNNQQKFIRCMQHDGVSFPNYAQDYWVAAQHYNSEPWMQLLTLWEYSNRHLAHFIMYIPDSALKHTITIEGSGPFTLGFIVKDYPEHMKHHLRSLFPAETFLENSFKMVY